MLRAKCRSEHSLRNYRQVLDSIGTFDPDHLKRWWARLRGRRLEDSTVRLHAAVAKAALRYLSEEGDPDASAALRWFRHCNVPRPEHSVIGQNPLSKEDLLKIRNALDERAQLALDVERFHGLRVSTLLRLKHENIVQHGENWWLVFRTKRKRLIELPSIEALCRRLLATEEPIFPWSRFRFYRTVLQAARKTLDRHVTVHDLRRSFGTRIYGATKDIELTRRMMGHASIATTQRYIVSDAEKMKRVVENL